MKTGPYKELSEAQCHAQELAQERHEACFVLQSPGGLAEAYDGFLVASEEELEGDGWIGGEIVLSLPAA